MDGCLDGCLDGWVDGCVDEWVDGCVDRCVNGWVDGSVDGWMEGRLIDFTQLKPTSIDATKSLFARQRSPPLSFFPAPPLAAADLWALLSPFRSSFVL